MDVSIFFLEPCFNSLLWCSFYSFIQNRQCTCGIIFYMLLYLIPIPTKCGIFLQYYLLVFMLTC